MTVMPLNFIIIEADGFIAADMEAGLRGASPDCTVFRASSVEDAATLPHDADRLTIFITSDVLARIEVSGLADLAARRGAEIVVREGLDSNAAVEARGFHSMQTPFTDAALLEVASEFSATHAA